MRKDVVGLEHGIRFRARRTNILQDAVEKKCDLRAGSSLYYIFKSCVDPSDFTLLLACVDFAPTYRLASGECDAGVRFRLLYSCCR